MRLVTFREGKNTRIGAVVDDLVVDLTIAGELAGKQCLPADMIEFLEMGNKGMTIARAAIRHAERYPNTNISRPFRGTRLEAPIPCPRKLLCLAANYSADPGKREETRRERSPWVFMKPASTTVNRPGGNIVLSRHALRVHWEAELAIVIGRRARYVDAKDASQYVAGYTIINDVSEREFRVGKRTNAAPWDEFFAWLHGKWPDGFAPMGPWIATPDELPDPLDLRIQLTVNGKTLQDARTSRLTHTCPELVAHISQWVTLEPGDVIATGTPPDLAAAKGVKLNPGDVVRAEIEGIGVLENKVVAEEKTDGHPDRCQ